MCADRPGIFVKRRTDAPADFFAWEATGLRWLGQARQAGGADVVAVGDVTGHGIELTRIDEVAATAAAAQRFGRALALTHASGAPAFGAGPPGWSGNGWIGRQRLVLQSFSRWGEFYARTRVLPFATAANGVGNLDGAGLHQVERLAERLIAGDFDDDRPPARIHGDLWGGNLLYAAGGGVLIDPAAHGGHGLTDVAMLALFGTQHLPRLLAGYSEAAERQPGGQDRIGLHQLHPLLVHAVSHGPSYGRQAVDVASSYL